MSAPATTNPPWIICDRAVRTAQGALAGLARRRHHLGMSVETLSTRSGLSLCTTTRALAGLGCNLAEFLALTEVLGVFSGDLLADAATLTNFSGESVNAA
jgi:hypothetical protein